MSDKNPITAADFPDIRWHGNWIWCDPPPPPRFRPGMESAGPDRPEVHALFRKTFTLEQVPGRAPARITADSRYLLYANGREVFRGPIRSQPRRMFYDLFDLAPYLKAGENVLAVYVKYYGSPKSFWMPAPPTRSLGRSGVMVFEAQIAAGQAPPGWSPTAPGRRTRAAPGLKTGAAGSRLGFMEEGIPVESIRRAPVPVRLGTARF